MGGHHLIVTIQFPPGSGISSSTTTFEPEQVVQVFPCAKKLIIEPKSQLFGCNAVYSETASSSCTFEPGVLGPCPSSGTSTACARLVVGIPHRGYGPPDTGTPKGPPAPGVTITGDRSRALAVDIHLKKKWFVTVSDIAVGAIPGLCEFKH